MNSPITYRPNFTSTNIGGYRYFFNGQEGDNEVFGEVANFGYEFRQYDSRLGRWWSVDSKWRECQFESPYCFGGNTPIYNKDFKGQYKLPAGEAKKSRLFTQYVNNYMKKDVLNSENIMRGLQTYGQLSIEQIHQVLTPGEGPTILIVKSEDIQGAMGEYDETRNIIKINMDAINQLNNAGKDRMQAALLLVVSTLLHETVHYGDFQTGGYEKDNIDVLIKSYLEGIPQYKSTDVDEKGLLFESDVYFYEGNTDVIWERTIENIEDAIDVISKKSETEQGKTDLPTIP